ncbi:hypothetical protein M408DRAFT_219948 [Serendipita vermifera MAFF 305830]|uniref:Uncharacterized protein n=1 Tax=Serendipita vermifera MAFF 305830 TaxID=933852 RepID=A0A0C2X2K9_SERVB|nr:hypothetical protein M408DRAFT_219948 [Serendipita vermifera MAFF 305830]
MASQGWREARRWMGPTGREMPFAHQVVNGHTQLVEHMRMTVRGAQNKRTALGRGRKSRFGILGWSFASGVGAQGKRQVFREQNERGGCPGSFRTRGLKTHEATAPLPPPWLPYHFRDYKTPPINSSLPRFCQNS